MITWIAIMLTAIVVLLALILYRLTGILSVAYSLDKQLDGVGYYVMALYKWQTER